MMNVNQAAFPMPISSPAALQHAGTGAENPQIQALEKKLQQLNKEKQEAQKKQDKDKVRELEKEIQATQQKLEQLKEKEQKKQKLQEQQKQRQEQSGQTPSYGTSDRNHILGIYVNRLA